MSVNKHYCQGTNCHTNTTQDRFQKSTGMLRGRYAYATYTDQRYCNDNFNNACKKKKQLPNIISKMFASYICNYNFKHVCKIGFPL